MNNRINNKLRIVFSCIITFVAIVLFAFALFPDIFRSIINYQDNQSPWNSPAVIIGHFTTSDDSGFPKSIDYILDNIYVNKNAISNQKNVTMVCLDNVEFKMDFTYRNIYNPRDIFNSNSEKKLNWNQYFNNLCKSYQDIISTNGYIQYSFITPQTFYITSNDINSENYYLYPYDSIIISLGISADVIYLGNNDQIISSTTLKPSMEIDQFEIFNNLLSNLQLVNTTPTGNIDLQRPELFFYNIKFARPIMLIIFTIFILIFLFFVPVFIPLIHDPGTVLQVIIAYFLGVWGVRQILLLPNDFSSSMLNTIFIGDYLLLLISLFFTFFLIILKLKQRNKIELEPSKFYSLSESDIYHNYDCATIRNRNVNDLIEYRTMEDVKNSGKKPCKLCKPIIK
jgi:hypothetical protein